MENSASRVVTAFGGLKTLHQETGIPETTIRSWLEQGFIGAPKTREYESKILAAAKRLSIDIGPDDLCGEAA